MSYDLYASRMVQIWTTVRIGNLNLMVILTEITIVRNCMWVGGKKTCLQMRLDISLLMVKTEYQNTYSLELSWGKFGTSS